jgi:hypothetical protein
MVSEVDTFLSVTDRSNGQTIRKDIVDLNSAVVNYYMQLTFTTTSNSSRTHTHPPQAHVEPSPRAATFKTINETLIDLQDQNHTMDTVRPQ